MNNQLILSVILWVPSVCTHKKNVQTIGEWFTRFSLWFRRRAGALLFRYGADCTGYISSMRRAISLSEMLSCSALS